MMHMFLGFNFEYFLKFVIFQENAIIFCVFAAWQTS